MKGSLRSEGFISVPLCPIIAQVSRQTGWEGPCSCSGSPIRVTRACP